MIDTVPADREVQSAYSIALANREYINSTTITEYDASNDKLYVKDVSVFPSTSTSTASYKGIQNAYRYRKVWLANGEWSWYESIGSDHLVLFDNPNTYGYSSGCIRGWCNF
jgi:hypothetical protein